MSLTFASLYSGCGGFDLGFCQAGFRCTGAFDIDPLAVRVNQLNLNQSATLCDLTAVEPSLGGLKSDVLLAGSPCQGFSTAGKRDHDDPRNSLLVLGGRIATIVRPKVFVAENVAGVVAGQHKQYWEALRDILRSAGYRTADTCCDAHQMGVAQRRRRMVMMAWLRERDVRIEIPASEGGVLSEAIRSINGAPNHNPVKLPPHSDAARIARHVLCGQKLSNVRGGPRSVHTWEIPEVFGKTNTRERTVLEALLKLRRQNRIRPFGDADPVSIRTINRYLGYDTQHTLESLIRKNYVRRVDALLDLTHTFNGKYRRLDLQSPSPTVDTRFGDPKYFLHPSSNRGLTVREAARIQGFPDTFVFEGSERAQYRLIGNAVPPPMARQIALFIRRVILEVR
jgi:DNA (cytosine-5)-methyltransferase 1